jgi:hypothetical protein
MTPELTTVMTFLSLLIPPKRFCLSTRWSTSLPWQRIATRTHSCTPASSEDASIEELGMKRPSASE